MHSKFGETLKSIRKSRNLSQEEFARVLGTSKQVVSRYETGQRTPNISVVQNFSSKLGIPIEILAGSDASATRSLGASPLPSNAMPVSTLYRIPIIGTVRAGAGGLALEDLEGYEMADVHNPEDYYFLRVVGDSMAPHINEGDLALIRKQDDVESGELAVVVIDGDEGTIKKIIKKPSTVILQAFNPEYPPRVFAGSELDGIHIAGKVVRTVRIW